MTRLRALFVLVCSAIAVSGCASQPSDRLIIRGATLLDGSGGQARIGADVIVESGTIRSVEPMQRRARGRVIDAAGAFLLPGYIDMHAHLLLPACDPDRRGPPVFDRATSEQMLSMMLDYGITMVRSPATPTEQGLALRDDLNAGRVRGPHALASAEFVNDASMGEVELRAYVRDALRPRPDYFKAYSSLPPASVRTLVDAAHTAGVPVIGHVQATSWREAAQIGIDHLTHAVDWSEETLPDGARAAYRQARRTRPDFRSRLDWLALLDPAHPNVDRMIEAMVAARVTVDPTLVAFDAKFSGNHARYRDHPAAQRIAILADGWRRCGDGTENWTDADRMAWGSLKPKLGLMLRRYAEAGILLTTGTDSTNPWVIPGEALHQEFELLVEAGFTPSEVLRMTGHNAARSLGLAGQVGTIAAGARADLVLLRSDPRENIANSRDIAWVMQSGRIVHRGDTAARLSR